MSLSRRRFLQVVGAGTAVVRCGDDPLEFDPKPGRWDCGLAAEYVEGELRFYEEPPILVGRDAGGYYAMSAICTHRACVIGDDLGEVGSEGGLLCSCHDSIFSRTGEALTGEARRDLPHYALEIDGDGRLFCDTRDRVDAATRLATV